jgi:hypothetical protein
MSQVTINLSTISTEAVNMVQQLVEKGRLTEEEWGVVTRANQRLTELTLKMSVGVPVAEVSECQRLLDLDLATLRAIGVREGVDLATFVGNATRSILMDTMGVALTSIRRYAVA